MTVVAEVGIAQGKIRAPVSEGLCPGALDEPWNWGASRQVPGGLQGVHILLPLHHGS